MRNRSEKGEVCSGRLLRIGGLYLEDRKHCGWPPHGIVRASSLTWPQLARTEKGCAWGRVREGGRRSLIVEVMEWQQGG